VVKVRALGMNFSTRPQSNDAKSVGARPLEDKTCTTLSSCERFMNSDVAAPYSRTRTAVGSTRPPFRRLGELASSIFVSTLVSPPVTCVAT
jgi:hypothetical protein